MKIAFIIERHSYFRHLGSLIDAALSRGYDVESWHNYSIPRTGPKGHDFPSIDVLPRFVNGTPVARSYQNPSDLSALLRKHLPSAVVSLTPSAWHFGGNRPNDYKSVWLTVPSGPEFWCLYGAQGCLSSDLLGVWSPYWFRWALEYFRDSGQTREGDRIEDQIAARIVFGGFPELDQLPLLDPHEIRLRYDLPANCPIVLLLQYPWKSTPPAFFSRRVYAQPSRARQVISMLAAGRFDAWPYVRKGWNDRRVVDAIRAFCDHNGALLIIKSRLKDPVPHYARTKADRVLFDASPYPTTILELLAISNLCIHFFSTAVYEAVSSGVPSVSIAVPEFIASPELDQVFFQKLYDEREGESFQCQGVTTVLNVPEAIERFPTQTLHEYRLNREARTKYLEKFVGCRDGRSSDRLLDALQDVVERGVRAKLANR